ncbi:hypothetical protein J7U46_08835 [Pelomonas sp. V22]|uniref:hypothetical protein n=1 Tax=Pelomonas sp. V22 TaxID=2822139 RepID=UPI0024A997C2|nr:hypothetical protein [Pelomonas sp. V22]MDI4633149.1 hypothetical protein [Pelomonas sp. V22]
MDRATSPLAVVPRTPDSIRKHKPHRSTTKAAYSRDLRRFVETYGFGIPCSPEDILTFIRLVIKKVAPATAYRRCMAIQSAHVECGAPSPTSDPRVREALRQLAARQIPAYLLDPRPASKRTKGPKVQPKQAKPISRAMLERIFDAMGTGRRSIDLRDKALMLLGFAGMKRGAMLALNITDCRFTADAMLVCVTDVTSDKSSDGEPARVGTIAIPRTRGPLCAATAVEVWLDHLDRRNAQGPLFCRFDRGCDPMPDVRLDAAWASRIVKRRMKEAGYEDVDMYSTESLRRGGAQEKVR